MTEDEKYKHAAHTGVDTAFEIILSAQDRFGVKVAMQLGFGLIQGVLRTWRSAWRNADAATFRAHVLTQVGLALDAVEQSRTPELVAREAASDLAAAVKKEMLH